MRIEAARLREKLREYYDAEGQSDPIRIELPKGTYTPQIEFRQATPGNARSLTQVQLDAVPFIQDQLAIVRPAAAIMQFCLCCLQVSAIGVLELRPVLPEKASIAVLPFDNIGTDPKWDRFADGITEDIITDLSHSKDLVVIARNSTELYKGKPIDIRQIGRDLNVKYVLEGSIQSMGDQIRVTAQLIEAASGSHIWSERYDRPVDDLFVVQNDVTQKIAATLAGYEGAVAEAERTSS